MLFNDMLIGVTAFFRDARAFNRLQEELNHYLHNKKNKVMRIWVPDVLQEKRRIRLLLSLRRF
ncbi:hypothetical protein THIOSC13_1880006 [uncultured Thiomicrorhabdus sp.]